jgi:hypothetical protein
MATRYSVKKGVAGKTNLGYQDGEQVDAFDIPSCTIEDVDRSVFNLFEKELDFTVESNKKMIKVPVIFATGERFALLARKKPLRDSSNALILPLISIMRTGITHTPGVGENIPMIVKKKLSPDDPYFQRYVNKQGIINDDQLAQSPTLDTNHGESEAGKKLLKQGASSGTPNNPLIANDFSTNVYEIYEIPPVKHYTANYEVTLWCQYTQQMNQMLMIFMGGYTNNNRPSFRLDTDKGYYFTSLIQDELSPEVNFDDFTDDERIVKCSITMKVPAYLIAPRSIGQPSPIRRFVSAPNISFTVHEGMDIKKGRGELSKVPSSDVDDYVLSDLEHELNTVPRQTIGNSSGDQDEQIESKLDSLGSTTLNNNIGSLGDLKEVKVKDPTTGKTTVAQVRVTERNNNAGETVFRPSDPIIDLGDLLD